MGHIKKIFKKNPIIFVNSPYFNGKFWKVEQRLLQNVQIVEKRAGIRTGDFGVTERQACQTFLLEK